MGLITDYIVTVTKASLQEGGITTPVEDFALRFASFELSLVVAGDWEDTRWAGGSHDRGL